MPEAAEFPVWPRFWGPGVAAVQELCEGMACDCVKDVCCVELLPPVI